MPPISKGEPSKRQKARTARQHAAARKACVDAVWKRDESCCQSCGRWLVRPERSENWMEVGHVHEIVYRSLGGSDTDVDNCQLLCASCHQKVHAKRLEAPHAATPVR